MDFRVQSEHVEQGIKLECTAAIGAVFWQSFHEKIPVIPRIEKSTSSSNWWRSSSGASSSSSFVQHVANLILGKQKIIIVCLYVYQIGKFKKAANPYYVSGITNGTACLIKLRYLESYLNNI